MAQAISKRTFLGYLGALPLGIAALKFVEGRGLVSSAMAAEVPAAANGSFTLPKLPYAVDALDRAIVMHPATYASPTWISKQGKLGRSEGCFAMAPDQFNEALWHLSGGRLLFADRIDVA